MCFLHVLLVFPWFSLRFCQDVPQNFLEELGKIWSLERTEYIDGVPELYTTKGTRFDGVFTKLNVTRLKICFAKALQRLCKGVKMC